MPTMELHDTMPFGIIQLVERPEPQKLSKPEKKPDPAGKSEEPAKKPAKKPAPKPSKKPGKHADQSKPTKAPLADLTSVPSDVDNTPIYGPKAQKLSDELAAATGKTAMSFDAARKWLYGYIKEKNLQDPKDGRFVCADNVLKRLTGESRFRLFGVQKHLKKHLLGDARPPAGAGGKNKKRKVSELCGEDSAAGAATSSDSEEDEEELSDRLVSLEHWKDLGDAYRKETIWDWCKDKGLEHKLSYHDPVEDMIRALHRSKAFTYGELSKDILQALLEHADKPKSGTQDQLITRLLCNDDTSLEEEDSSADESFSNDESSSDDEADD